MGELPHADLAQAEVPTAEVTRERCAFLYRKLKPASVATLVLSALLSAFLWRLAPLALVVSWQASMIFFAAVLWHLSVGFGRPGAPADAAQWIRRVGFAAVGLGAGWGFAAAMFFPGAQEQQVVICFAVALAVAGGQPFFSVIWPVYALYAAAALLPFAAVLFAYGNDFFRLLGAAVPLLYVANVWTARELSRIFRTAYGVRTAYQRLASDNQEIQSQLAEQLDSLLDAHREVQAHGRKLSLFSERAPIAVLEVDRHATILSMNPAAENLFGWAASEVVGRNVITMMLSAEDSEPSVRWWAEFVAAAKPETVVLERCLRRDGLALACEWTLTPLENDAGELTSVVLQGRDITQQRATELIRREFTSTLSHELRTPLTSMLGSLELLSSGVLGDLASEQTEIVEVAERNGRRLLDLINEVLDIEKLESGRLTLAPEPLELAELVRESVRLNQGFADRFRVQLSLQEDVPFAVVRADRKRLMQVMTNLLSNAAKFSPPNGVVDVTVQVYERHVRVDVSDRGTGIPEAFRSRIFGRFAQAASADSRIRGGSGLGLAISKRLVELMGGSIGFEDRPGGGTVFFFELPVLESAHGAGEEAARVLITEQDAVAAEYLAMVLEKAGYRVDSVPDAQASRDLLARWRYVAWLLSSRAGDEIPGLLEELRDRCTVPIVMLAGVPTDKDAVAEPSRHRIVDWLLKSDSRDRIVEVVRQAAGQSAVPAAT